jgi:cell division protein FtsN
MPSREQGVYEPSDEVRVFDGAEDDDDEEGSRLPLLIVIALLVLAAFGGAVWLAYEHGVSSGRNEPRMLIADSGAVKVMPSDSGGTETPYKGLKIYEQQAPGDEDADAPQQPAATPNRTTSPPASAGAAAPGSPAPGSATPNLRPPVESMAANSPPPVNVVTATVQSAGHVARPPSSTKPEAVETQPVQPTANQAQAAPLAHPRVHVQFPTQVATAEPATSVPHASVPGGYLLQVGSYKSQDEADGAWKSFKAKHLGNLAGFTPDVKRVDLGDKGIWYRLRVGSFADKNSASDLCTKLKADGASCFLAR